MAESSPSFLQFLNHLRQADEDAARQAYSLYAGRLIGLARTRLGSQFQAKLDPEDVVQSVFQTVFRRVADNQFDLVDWDSLWGLLIRVTIFKCCKWQDHFTAQARSVHRETAWACNLEDSSAVLEFMSREPAAEEVVVLKETLEQALHGLEGKERDIAARSIQGETPAAISAALACSESKVRRVLRHLRARLERLTENP